MGGAERNVNDSLDGDGNSVALGGSEFPSGEGVHGNLIEDGIKRADDLYAIHVAVFANDGEEDDFAFDVRVDLVGRIARINFVIGHGAGKCGLARTGVRRVAELDKA